MTDSSTSGASESADPLLRAPTLCDSEVLTIEVVGEFLRLDEDTELFAYFRRHYAHFFPNLRQVHRTTFTRQAANLWKG